MKRSDFFRVTRSRRWMRGCAAAALWGCIAAVAAQEAVQDVTPAIDMGWGDRSESARPSAGLGSIGGLQLVEIAPAGPNQRPRRALRMRFDSATRAMRSLGVDAHECTSLIRSNTGTYRPDPASSERLRINVSVAMNCRFF